MPNYNYPRLRRIARKKISEIAPCDQAAFNRWLSVSRSSTHSKQMDLPSSQIATRESFVNADIPQLFVVIDTCSLVSYRSEFIDYIVDLKNQYTENTCPIRFIISLQVLEELDKCNRRRKPKQILKNDPIIPVASRPIVKDVAGSGVRDILRIIKEPGESRGPSEPPRLFMRFLEEEMRLSQFIISELDPFKTVALKEERPFEILNSDDRILECCIRSRAFINSLPHHKDTKLILVSEDNLFKSKATAYMVASYRWREYQLKFKNFGQANCMPTPQVPSINQIKLSYAEPKAIARISAIQAIPNGCDKAEKKIAEESRRALKRIVGLVNLEGEDKTADDEAVTIVKELINLR